MSTFKNIYCYLKLVTALELLSILSCNFDWSSDYSRMCGEVNSGLPVDSLSTVEIGSSSRPHSLLSCLKNTPTAKLS